MIRTFLFASIAVLSACRTAHLGDDTGVAYRSAFAAQRESEPAKAPAFGADDAHATNSARRATKGGAAQGAPAGGSIVVPMGMTGSSSSSGGGGAWPGAQGGIKLEAK